MKKILMAGMTAVAVMMSLQVQAMKLSEAQAKLAEAAEKPATMAEIMKQLSAEDQVSFLSMVNESIDKMPISDEKKVALYVDANKMALESAQQGNVANLLAESFATVSLQALSVMNELFAKELFSRDADPTRPISDAQMTEYAMSAMKAVAARAETATYPTERKAFAALMMIRASKGTPADLKEKLLADLPKVVSDTWIPAALDSGNYEAMMGDLLTEAPDAAGVIRVLAAPEILTGSLITDLAATKDAKGTARAPFSAALLDPIQYAMPEDVMDYGVIRRPRTLNKDNKWYNANHRGPGHNGSNGTQPSEPEHYDRLKTK